MGEAHAVTIELSSAIHECDGFVRVKSLDSDPRMDGFGRRSCRGRHLGPWHPCDRFP